jgi:hypothetical protein
VFVNVEDKGQLAVVDAKHESRSGTSSRPARNPPGSRSTGRTDCSSWPGEQEARRARVRHRQGRRRSTSASTATASPSIGGERSPRRGEGRARSTSWTRRPSRDSGPGEDVRGRPKATGSTSRRARAARRTASWVLVFASR